MSFSNHIFAFYEKKLRGGRPNPVTKMRHVGRTTRCYRYDGCVTIMSTVLVGGPNRRNCSFACTVQYSIVSCLSCYLLV